MNLDPSTQDVTMAQFHNYFEPHFLHMQMHSEMFNAYLKRIYAELIYE